MKPLFLFFKPKFLSRPALAGSFFQQLGSNDYMRGGTRHSPGRTGVCTTEYHTIFYHSYFMSQVYIMDYYWFFGKVFPVVFLPVGCCG